MSRMSDVALGVTEDEDASCLGEMSTRRGMVRTTGRAGLGIAISTRPVLASVVVSPMIAADLANAASLARYRASAAEPDEPPPGEPPLEVGGCGNAAATSIVVVGLPPRRAA